MRIALFNDYRIGSVEGTQVSDVTDVVDARWHGTPYVINEFIAHWDQIKSSIPAVMKKAGTRELSDVRLLSPIPLPGQVLAAPANYHAHVSEMTVSRHRPTNAQALLSPREAGFFVKSSRSISGPADAIELPPIPGRSFHHEVELGVVVGKPARSVSQEQAREHIFGYLVLLDITMRTDGEHQEERTMRKSFETFTPIGPFIVTVDEVVDHAALRLRLWVNDELRQDANTADLIVGVDELIERASAVVTLQPGDIYATGTPDGVGPIEAGDIVRASIDGLGEMAIPVTKRDW